MSVPAVSVSSLSSLYSTSKLNPKTLFARLVNPFVLFFGNMMPHSSASMLACYKTEALVSTCTTWAKMPFEVPKTYGQCAATFTGKCALVTLLLVSQLVLVRE